MSYKKMRRRVLFKGQETSRLYAVTVAGDCQRELIDKTTFYLNSITERTLETYLPYRRKHFPSKLSQRSIGNLWKDIEMFYIKKITPLSDGTNEIVIQLYSACCKQVLTFIEDSPGHYIDMRTMDEAASGTKQSIDYARKMNIVWKDDWSKP